MQVKKFEAKNIHEAIDLVKTTLGPEAIILSARDNSSRFGIGGEKSIEVTAAISEEMIHKKRIAEKKLTDSDRQKFLNSPAKLQKEFISKAIDKSLKDYQKKKRRFTETPYIDIMDEGESQKNLIAVDQNPIQTKAEVLPFTPVAPLSTDSLHEKAQLNIRKAAEQALQAISGTGIMSTEQAQQVMNPVNLQIHEDKNENSSELNFLRKEVEVLREIVNQFHKVPQNFLTLHPGAQEGISFELSFMFEKLIQAGVSRENVVEILQQAKNEIPKEKIKKKPFVDAWVAKFFLKNIEVSEGRNEGLFHFFVGPNSQGKTSSLVKFATELVVLKKRKVVILTTDTIKVGASDQLKIYAQILNVPFAQVRSLKDWGVLKDNLNAFDHVLVDFPGLNLKNIRELEFLQQHFKTINSARIHYVQSLLVNEKEAFTIASRYNALGIHDVIYTKLDELSQFGLIYNFQKEFNWPVHSYSIGPKIPEDFEAGTKERFVDLVFKLSNGLKRGEG